ncbi:MAG: 50S ribosomal protein L6 [Nanoarchaeota archaeon]|nr:50S ribosomal protein L6 [Nanoarchaeota archaeon]
MSIKFNVLIPENIDLRIDGKKIYVKSEKGELSTDIRYSFLNVTREGKLLRIIAQKDNDFQKAIAGTLAANVRNMIKGVTEGYTATLELVYSHFPASLKLDGKKLLVENFVGERKSREILIPEGVDIKVHGTQITLSGIDKYLVGQTAGSIEAATKLKAKDRRVFKDGIYITKKP